MTSKVLLSLDLSTTCTGWSTFNLNNKKLIKYGHLKPKVPLVSKMKYPEKQLKTCKNVAEKVLEIVLETSPELIVIEEINKHKNRMAGKTLDILHGFVWDLLEKHGYLEKVSYMDSDGKDGWRSRKCLNLVLSDADRQFNRDAKFLNQTMGKNHQKINKITKKHLAARFVNKYYGTEFDVDVRKSDEDECDSVGLGHAFLHYIL